MGKRYYCDYCDRTYPYSVEARKKHAFGHYHQKLKTLHYDQFKSAKERLQDELSKEKCRRFHSGQECSFGDTCIYSHLTVADICSLKHQAKEEDNAARKRKLPTLVKDGKEPSLEGWQSMREIQMQPSSDYSVEDLAHWELKYTLPPSLKDVAFLPPSLIPPSSESLLQCEFTEWG
ncbi:zinc finger matrin-type protein 5-like [Homarus americanus]|uniref:Zinc finger matrin-type protein 5-like n=1 Tax=Homarus americanus TaxID=6706 RepID=A0A8J5N033_HOMAM|nr:zinc finger matrin-type protein 5-like [Homarus americanus]XP_042220139.1 zinc finger matrin-type protein 5-like [Homarus americanus]XP_042220140.1 zinc finger matrin-type protein 5-like [Homarus americanus]KAG7170044.1 Zinc finger matrin-type protein 5-like [Homarus americanus]